MKHFFEEVENIIPISLMKKKWFHLKSENLYKIHFPKTEQEFEEARRELAYEELYKMQFEWLKRKKDLAFSLNSIYKYKTSNINV